IEESGMEPVTFRRYVHRKGDPGPRFVGVTPEAADALEDRTVGQAGCVEDAVEVVRRDLPGDRAPGTGLKWGRIGGVQVVLYAAGDVELPGGRLREAGALHPEGRSAARRLEVEMDPDRFIRGNRESGLVQEIADNRPRESECLDRCSRHRLQDGGGGKHDSPEDAVVAEKGELVEVDEDLEMRPAVAEPLAQQRMGSMGGCRVGGDRRSSRGAAGGEPPPLAAKRAGRKTHSPTTLALECMPVDRVPPEIEMPDGLEQARPFVAVPGQRGQPGARGPHIWR